MDKNRYSSLPTSLIPHLYDAPNQPRDSSTRTTLPDDDYHPVSPLLYPRHWREGEPGPSSLIQPHDRYPYERDWSPYERSQYERSQGQGQSQSQLERSQYERSRYESVERTRYTERSEPYWPSSPAPYQQLPFQTLPPPQQMFTIPPQEDSSIFDRHDAYTYPPAGLSLSAPSSAHLTGNPSMYRSTSVTHSLDNDRDTDTGVGGSQDGKRRRAESLSTDDGARKSKKTAVACNFCRGRKLRCNGAKPSCHNCTVRKFECEYVPIQRRRGPGKKNGSRSKKAPSSSKNVADRPPSAVPEYELDALAPELRPHMSVMALNNYGFQPPNLSPHYPTQQDPRFMRDPYSSETHFRSRETSSEDRSDAEVLYRNMG